MSILQRLYKRRFIDQTTAGAVDDSDAAFCFLQTRCIKDVTRFRRERCVQRNKIRVDEQIMEFVHELNLQAAGAGCGKIGIVSNHPHSESDGTPAQLAANAAHADYAEGLVIELDALEILFTPMFAANVRIGLQNLARHRKQK